MIRADNLRALMDAKGWGTSELGRKVGRSPGQMGDMLAGRKPFGEKIARHIEHCLELPRGWLDQIHDGEEAPKTSAGQEPDLLGESFKKTLQEARAAESAIAAQLQHDFSPQARRVAKALDSISDSAKRSQVALALLDIIDEMADTP